MALEKYEQRDWFADQRKRDKEIADRILRENDATEWVNSCEKLMWLIAAMLSLAAICMGAR